MTEAVLLGLIILFFGGLILQLLFAHYVLIRVIFFDKEYPINIIIWAVTTCLPSLIVMLVIKYKLNKKY